MINITNLRKTYDAVVAVDDISFEVQAGEIYGLLGPNGAGKTTTVNIVSGLLKQTSGAVRIAGYDISREPKKAKAAMGIVPQELALYPELSAREIREILMQSAVPYEGDVYLPGTDEKVPFSDLTISGGIVNAYEAIKIAQNRITLGTR